VPSGTIGNGARRHRLRPHWQPLPRSTTACHAFVQNLHRGHYELGL